MLSIETRKQEEQLWRSKLKEKILTLRLTLFPWQPNSGMHGSPLVEKILKFLGVTDCLASSNKGNQEPSQYLEAMFVARQNFITIPI